MTIQPDHWIRKMATEHGMIEPFVEKQVSNHVISYGVSSYGYDIRVADEFRIFTPSTGQLTVVDPKAIDERAMVPYQGDTCIIPPNSFALARTVEYFRVPRNILCICLGKSTYARCFRGDTRVALVDGSAPTLEAMAQRAARGERFLGYSVAANGEVIVALLEAPRYIGRDLLVEVTLDNGRTVACTPDHRFMLRDGSWLPAGDLRPGASLMPLYRTVQRDDTDVYQPHAGSQSSTRQMVQAWQRRHGIPVGHRQGAGQGQRPPIAPAAMSQALPSHVAAANHKVIAVRTLPGDHDVFCLTVPETGNFALEDGIFVHNCGIVVNVTPFEPEWEGFVTIEISNTTPLPAKIYANEGIAQVLFLEGDPPEISYADRKGKYQAQTGITLPRL